MAFQWSSLLEALIEGGLKSQFVLEHSMVVALLTGQARAN